MKNWLRYVLWFVCNVLSTLSVCFLVRLGAQHYVETGSVVPFLMVFAYGIGGIFNDIAFKIYPVKKSVDNDK